MNKAKKLGLMLLLVGVVIGITIVPRLPIPVPFSMSPVDWDWGSMEILKRFVLAHTAEIEDFLPDGPH